jgi:hypothetical protein
LAIPRLSQNNSKKHSAFRFLKKEDKIQMLTDILSRGLDNTGSIVDSVFLAVPRFLKSFKPRRKIDRDTYSKQIDFYFENGYVDDPVSFFTFPSQTPPYTIVHERDFMGGKRQLISFPSGYIPRNPMIRESFQPFTANRTGYLVRWTHGKPNAKTILCLHGYMLGDPRQAERMFKVRTLFSKGVDVALFITPFHWKRAPRSKALRGIFLQPDDVVMTCECLGQAQYDLHSTVRILRAMGSRAVGLIGGSLGGYNTGLAVCLMDDIAFGAMMVPAVNFAQPFGPDSMKLNFTVDEKLREKINAVWQLHSPLNFKPRIPKEHILIIASRGDRLCPFDHTKTLCERWGWPKHHFMTGGHWLMFNASQRGRAWYAFLAERGFLT